MTKEESCEQHVVSNTYETSPIYFVGFARGRGRSRRAGYSIFVGMVSLGYIQIGAQATKKRGQASEKNPRKTSCFKSL